jgi:hypothetical protein
VIPIWNPAFPKAFPPRHQRIEAARMISEHFDTRTRINMKLALDRVCRSRPRGEDHGFRRSVAENIIRCAFAGRTGIGQLVDAGERAMIRTHAGREPA